MASGTKIRPLARLLDASDAPLWAIGPSGRLVYLSAGCAEWLGIDVDSLLDRRSVAGAPVSTDPLDCVAAALSPPQGLSTRGSASLRISPPAFEDHRAIPLEVRFLRVGEGDSAIVLAVAGSFDDRTPDAELKDAIAIRQRLDAWRKRHAAIASTVTAGNSAVAKRLRRRMRVAAATRSDIGFFGAPGTGGESILNRIHELSAPGENLINVDGPLMDSELLDATLMPAVHQLAESREARASTLVRGLDEMPYEAQQRLASLLDTFSGRLRLLAVCGRQIAELGEPIDESINESIPFEEEEHRGLCTELIEVISALTISNRELAERVDDIPLLATSMLDARRASGEGVAERFSRAALDALVIYPWPRNHDELDDAVRHALRTAAGNAIAVEHLPLAIRSYRPGEQPSRGIHANLSLDDAVQRYEHRLILEALESADGNRAEAARQLGISRARLLRRIDEHNRTDLPSDGE
ncbi:MAG: helix-turn-helix domain-containing protein [Rubripirellula sp.]